MRSIQPAVIIAASYYKLDIYAISQHNENHSSPKQE